MTELDLAPGLPSPGRVGQGTAVEMSRAFASIQAMVALARQFPRNEQQAKARMVMACRQPELAEKAFYAYPRGGETVSGLTIIAARELARCWGNLDYGLTEMRRDEVYGQSEMLAYCWELETNVCDRHTFIVQHVRTGSGKKLTDTRDIYEVNTNDGNRRKREAILGQLPRWYKLLAEKTLRETLKAVESSDGKSPEEQAEAAIAWFAKEFNVTLDQLEHRLGCVRRRWTPDDVVELRILGNSLKRREVGIEDVFPSAKVTVEELATDAEEAGESETQDSPEAPAEGADQAPDRPEGDATDEAPRYADWDPEADDDAA